MAIPADTPFLYRFRSTRAEDGGLKVYGPRPFEQVVQYYAAREECEARPEHGPEAGWRPVSEWADEYEPPMATERQVKRLAKLGVTHGRDISQDGARRLIREAEDQLPPTKRLLEKAESAGVTVSEADTRHSLKAKIEETGRLEEVVRLRKLGAEVAEDTSWEELSEWEDRLEIEEELKRKGLTFPPGTSLGELEDARYALEDLKEAAAHARQAGIRYRIEKGISVRDAQAHAAALSVVGDVYESLHYYYDGGAGSPKKTELKEALELLFERLKSGIVAEDDAYEWIEGRIGLERTGAAAGCLSLAAVLLPLSLALVGLFGVLG